MIYFLLFQIRCPVRISSTYSNMMMLSEIPKFSFYNLPIKYILQFERKIGHCLFTKSLRRKHKTVLRSTTIFIEHTLSSMPQNKFSYICVSKVQIHIYIYNTQIEKFVCAQYDALLLIRCRRWFVKELVDKTHKNTTITNDTMCATNQRLAITFL